MGQKRKAQEMGTLEVSNDYDDSETNEDDESWFKRWQTLQVHLEISSSEALAKFLLEAYEICTCRLGQKFNVSKEPENQGRMEKVYEELTSLDVLQADLNSTEMEVVPFQNVPKLEKITQVKSDHLVRFRCSDCNKVYRTEKALNLHKKIHNRYKIVEGSENEKKCRVDRDEIKEQCIEMHNTKQTVDDDAINEVHENDIEYIKKTITDDITSLNLNENEKSPSIILDYDDCKDFDIATNKKTYSKKIKEDENEMNDENLGQIKKRDIKSLMTEKGIKVKRKYIKRLHNNKKDVIKQSEKTPGEEILMVKDEFLIKQEKCFTCEYCGKELRNAQLLKHHIRTHTGVRPFKCKSCDKAFIDYKGLQNHTRVHTGERPYVCSQCSMTFNQRSNMKRHIQNVHSKVRSFLCQFCDARFGRLDHLQNHEKSHLGHKPFKCSTCDMQFILKQQLQKHEVIHAEHEKVVCDQCNKSFIRMDRLIAHKKKHEITDNAYASVKKENTSRNIVLRGRPTKGSLIQNNCDKDNADIDARIGTKSGPPQSVVQSIRKVPKLPNDNESVVYEVQTDSTIKTDQADFQQGQNIVVKDGKLYYNKHGQNSSLIYSNETSISSMTVNDCVIDSQTVTQPNTYYVYSNTGKYADSQEGDKIQYVVPSSEADLQSAIQGINFQIDPSMDKVFIMEGTEVVEAGPTEEIVLAPDIISTKQNIVSQDTVLISNDYHDSRQETVFVSCDTEVENDHQHEEVMLTSEVISNDQIENRTIEGLMSNAISGSTEAPNKAYVRQEKIEAHNKAYLIQENNEAPNKVYVTQNNEPFNKV